MSTVLTWREIPGAPRELDFADVYRDAVERAPARAHFVEVGTLHGRSVAFLATQAAISGKRIQIDAVDNFAATSTPGSWRSNMRRARLADVVRLLELDAVEAAALYPDGSVDFVFLDADHSYEATRAAIRAWLPKVRAGGALAGHDYKPKFPGVVLAVAEELAGARIVGESFVYRVGA